MRQCPNCKTNNPDDARFCNYCGMRLPESKEETLYSDLDELEETPKTEFSDQEIEEESEKVIDEAKKLLNPDEKEEKEVFLQEEKKEERKEDEDTDTEQEQLKKQLTIPENLDRMIEEVTRQELEQELHRKIKLKEGSGKEQSHLDETEGVSEPTLMIGEKTEEEADEPTRMFTGDIGDFIKKKREYEDVPEEDAYEEILQSWERKRKEKKIKREREGKDPSRIPKFIKEKHSWSDLTAKQKKAVKRIVAGAAVFAAFCIFESYYGRPEAVAERYCKAYVKEDWKKTGHLSDLPKNGYATQDEYTTYMKKNAVTGVEDYQIKETKENRQIKIESGGKQRAFTVEYKTKTQGKNKETVVLQKQKRQRLLLFANWKVSSDKMIANDFNLYIPAGSTAWIDGTKLTKNDKIKDDSDGLDQYKISLFEGNHKIRIDVPWFKTYKSEFKASDKGSTTISKMKVSQSGKKKLDKKMKEILSSYIKAAKEEKSFCVKDDLIIQIELKQEGLEITGLKVLLKEDSVIDEQVKQTIRRKIERFLVNLYGNPNVYVSKFSMGILQIFNPNSKKAQYEFSSTLVISAECSCAIQCNADYFKEMYEKQVPEDKADEVYPLLFSTMRIDDIFVRYLMQYEILLGQVTNEHTQKEVTDYIKKVYNPANKDRQIGFQLTRRPRRKYKEDDLTYNRNLLGHGDIEKAVSEEKIRQLSRSIMDVLWFSLWNKAE